MSAAERAVGKLRATKWADIPWNAVTVLMADPDLLVDLAIEAGGLEHAFCCNSHRGELRAYLWVSGNGEGFPKALDPPTAPLREPNAVPLYRRTTQENDRP